MGDAYKVIGFGDNVADRYTNARIMFPGGNAVNFAVYAKEAGMDSSYLGVFGNDDIAEHIKASLTEIGVDISHCVTKEGESGFCDVRLETGDRIFEEWNEGGISTKEPIVLDKKEIDYLSGFAFIHSGCYANLESELPKLKDLNAILSFDFSEYEEYKEDEYLEKVCPYIDIAQFSTDDFSDEEMETFAKHVCSYGTKYVLMTQGSKGQTFYDGERCYKGEVHMVEPVDTMGAGDSFMTAFTMTLLKRGWNKDTRPSEKAIRESFETAAEFSAKNCLREGSFGYKKSY